MPSSHPFAPGGRVASFKRSSLSALRALSLSCLLGCVLSLDLDTCLPAQRVGTRNETENGRGPNRADVPYGTASVPERMGRAKEQEWLKT